jgi:hypothetical protein
MTISAEERLHAENGDQALVGGSLLVWFQRMLIFFRMAARMNVFKGSTKTTVVGEPEVRLATMNGRP